MSIPALADGGRFGASAAAPSGGDGVRAAPSPPARVGTPLSAEFAPAAAAPATSAQRRAYRDSMVVGLAAEDAIVSSGAYFSPEKRLRSELSTWKAELDCDKALRRARFVVAAAPHNCTLAGGGAHLRAPLLVYLCS